MYSPTSIQKSIQVSGFLWVRSKMEQRLISSQSEPTWLITPPTDPGLCSVDSQESGFTHLAIFGKVSSFCYHCCIAGVHNGLLKGPWRFSRSEPRASPGCSELPSNLLKQPWYHRCGLKTLHFVDTKTEFYINFTRHKIIFFL